MNIRSKKCRLFSTSQSLIINFDMCFISFLFDHICPYLIVTIPTDMSLIKIPTHFIHKEKEAKYKNC